MTPVAKPDQQTLPLRAYCHHSVKNSRGQLMLFFAATVMLLVSVIAFIINVGMFVKAKINLQNAVDAAAFSGAAVQARQMSNIAYMNWEMRNNYKEWMFKYYVLGEISNPKTRPPDYRGTPGEDVVDFRLPKFDSGINTRDGDYFNIPSTCIHFTGTYNICAIYNIPGLPRFESVGFPGLDETHNNFINTIVKTKSRDCSKRTDFNFLAALSWAYGTGQNQLILEDTPQLANNRPGAWPQAIEMAVRIRNLEKLVNEPPHPEPICLGASGCTNVNELNQEGNGESIPSNERKIKAFWAGFRNLGFDAREDELKVNFKLTEIPPQPFAIQPNSLSQLLIPGDVGEKHYIDLQLYLLNLVTFYTSFVSQTELSGPVNQEAQCGVAKTALPIPGFPFGYVKNPNVLTYYAVKGESKYIGLFFPFNSDDGIDMVAYAAAKPFGGRIGPRLFQIDSSGQNITGRTFQGKSSPYVSALDPGNNTTFQRGFPIPFTADFWANSPDSVIGGKPQAGNVRFAIPNLLYDYVGNMDQQQGPGGDAVQVLDQTNFNSPATAFLGLYDREQFEAMNANLNNGNALNSDTPLDRQTIEEGILKARGPTKYEAQNYMIPTLDNRAENIDSVSYVFPVGVADGALPPGVTAYRLFAPLAGPGTYYPGGIQEILDVVKDYIQNNEAAVDAYMRALKTIADSIVRDGRRNAGGNYIDAANSIHDSTGGNPSCASVAGKFFHFYNSIPCDNGVNSIGLADSIQRVLDKPGWSRKCGSVLKVLPNNLLQTRASSS